MTPAKTDRVVVGIDPGGRESGVVVRWGAQLLDHAVITVKDPREAVAGIREFVAMSQGHHGFHAHMTAVEDVQAPNPHMGVTNVSGLLSTAIVLGAVLATWPDAVVVTPGGHGSGPRMAYPPQLVGPREGAAMAGKLRHCRSAWDLAGVVTFLERIAS